MPAGIVAAPPRRSTVMTVVLYSAMTLLPQLASGFLAIMYTRAFSTGEYANYGIFAAVYALISTVMDLGLPSGMLRNFFGRGKAAREYFGSAISGARFAMLPVAAVIAFFLYLGWDSIGVRFSQKLAFIPVLVAIAYVDRSEEVLATICRALERPTLFAFGRVVHGAVLIAAGAILVFVFRLGVMGSLLALLAAECSAWLAFRLALQRELGIAPAKPVWSDLRESMRFGLPLVPNRLAGWARLLAIRPVLAHVVSASPVGVFSFASSLAAVPTLLSSGVELALGPVYYRNREDGDVAIFRKKIRNFAEVYTGALLPLWVVMILFCPDVVRLITDPIYIDAGPVCSVLLCATFIRMQFLFLTAQLNFVRKTWILPAITIPVGCVGLVLIAFFAGRYGVIAAAWGVWAMDLTILLSLAWTVHRLDGLNYPIGSCLAVVTLISVLAAAVSGPLSLPLGWGLLTTNRMLVVMGSIAFCSVFWIWPNRALIRELVSR